MIERLEAWRDRSPIYRQNELGRLLNGIRGSTVFKLVEIALDMGEHTAEWVLDRKGLRIERRIHGADSIAAMRIEQMERELAQMRHELGAERKPAIRKGEPERRLAIRKG